MKPSDSYLRCVKRFALRPLKYDAEYRAAVDLLGRLASRENLGQGEQDDLSPHRFPPPPPLSTALTD